MPFSLGQMFGGWRRRDTKARGRSSESSLSLSRSSSKDDGGKRGARPRLELSSAPPRASSDSAAVGKNIKNKSETAWNVIRSPHISEKATMLGEGKYIFKVVAGADKPGIKKAIEERYGVLVDAVRVVNTPAKSRRRGAVMGEKAGFKKAIITLKEGNLINEF